MAILIVNWSGSNADRPSLNLLRWPLHRVATLQLWLEESLSAEHTFTMSSRTRIVITVTNWTSACLLFLTANVDDVISSKTNKQHFH